MVSRTSYLKFREILGHYSFLENLGPLSLEDIERVLSLLLVSLPIGAK